MQLPKLKESLRYEGLIYLRRLLTNHYSLPKTYPLTRIECFDVSNIQGTNATVALVCFVNGQSAKDQYRLFNIRTLNTPNDFAMMQEALIRRQNHSEWGVPNLLILDGGKGQLRSVLKVWKWRTPVIAIAKKPDRLIFPIIRPETEKKKKTGRKVVPIEDSSGPDLTGLTYHEVRLDADNPALLLAQQLRDEAHRFSKFQHTRMRDRAMLE